jgi:ribosomal subunit interface protein
LNVEGIKMRLKINSKEVRLSVKRRKIIKDKLGKQLDKYLKYFPEEIKQASVRVEKGPRWGYKISFSMRLPKREHIFAENANKKFINAVTGLREELETQIAKYKEKIQNKSK